MAQTRTLRLRFVGMLSKHTGVAAILASSPIRNQLLDTVALGFLFQPK